MPDRVRITEVGPRDGLQNEPGVIPTAEKVRLVELCAATGVDEVEVTSFVSPKWVPQLGDASEVFQGLVPWLAPQWNTPRPTFSVLVPNEKGMEAAIKTDVELLAQVQAQLTEEARGELEHWARGPAFIEKISVFTAASETFSRKNTNASIDESLERFRSLLAHRRNWPFYVRGYISCVIACPFEGEIHPSKVADVAQKLIALGVNEIDLGDTIGAADVASTVHLLEVMRDRLGETWWTADRMTIHLHDTFNRAADCVKAALDLGVRSFDGSVAGLGGCPYASTPGKRAPGNISTETLVRTIHAAGYETGVDLDKLAAAADFAREIVAKARAGGSA